MQRNLLSHLENWLNATDRKPLVIRGARQVGKTWLARHFCKEQGRELIELNFEKQFALAGLFESNDPKQILLNLSASLNKHISPENSILFLDEIQAAPKLLSKLRWFYEELPELPVICAGSLLEFLLSDHSFSVPVGRISYVHLEPLSFEEFLLANEQAVLLDYLKNFTLEVKIPKSIHQQLMNLFREYLVVGGLPEVVQSWARERSLSKVHQIQHDLLATYRDDFSKYKGRLATERLDEVISAIPKMVGQKFVFSKINKSVSSVTIKQVLSLFENARISHRVKSCFANGLPLGAEVHQKFFKEIFLDTGLCSNALGLDLNQLHSCEELIMVNSGGIAEQVVGQQLRTISQPYVQPELYYWHRDDQGSNAEIDYVLQHRSSLIPIEVKAGSSGSLKSLHLFMGLKGLSQAVRINSDLPSKTAVNLKNSLGKQVSYELISLPFYLIGQLHRLLDSHL